jgi:signal peptidase I
MRMKLSCWGRPKLTFLLFFLFICLWLTLAPVQLGGSKSYVIVAGNSMDPEFQFGDLVIVNRSPHYVIGDVVAYKDPYIGPVFHRIIAYSGDRFVLQGDNNSWIDPYSPKSDEVIGKFWLCLPGFGEYVRILREPANYAAIVVVFIGITFFPKKQPKGPQGKREKRMKKNMRMFTQRERFYEIVITFGVIALFALIFLIFSFSKPTTIVVEEQAVLNHLGMFEYSAEAVEGLYDNPVASSGEPIFLSISDTIEVHFAYTLGADELTQVKGIYELVAQINDDTGWKRTFKLTPVTSFEGNSFTTSGLVYIPHIERVVEYFEKVTGVSRSSLHLSVIPRISVSGMYGTREIDGQFSPRLEFTMSESLIWMTIGEDDTEPFTETEVSTIGVPVVEPNTVGFFAWQLRVLTLRILSVLVLLGVFAGGGWYGWKMYQVSERGEYQQIEFYYGSQLVHLVKQPVYEDLMELQDFESLARLAKDYGVKILHVYHKKQHLFFLPLEEGVFTFKLEEKGDEP